MHHTVLPPRYSKLPLSHVIPGGKRIRKKLNIKQNLTKNTIYGSTIGSREATTDSTRDVPSKTVKVPMFARDFKVTSNLANANHVIKVKSLFSILKLEQFSTDHSDSVFKSP